MLLNVVAVKDNAMDAFARPIFVPSHGVAMRSFLDEVNKPDSPMRAHPEDYALYALGTFSEETGLFADGSPRMLCRAVDMIRKEG